ncbi:MAG: IS66 family transposase [Candidatus Omnitrophica bacterium]|nr:IS66 family transposase [Candidatus Omnitrophota bacterium]
MKKKNCKSCQEYKKRIETLEEELAFIKFELEQLRGKRFKPKKKQDPPKAVAVLPQANRKKKGGLFGHSGWFRKKPKKIDRIEEVTLDKCPECGGRHLMECDDTEEHVQEDIILPVVEAVLFKRHHYYCYSCKQVVAGKGNEELPKSYIGPKAKALAVYLKYVVKVSERDIKEIFEKVFGLKIVPSSIAGFRDQLKKQAYPIYEELVESLRKSRFIHVDETGWKVDGQNRWLWKFSTKKTSVTHIDKSRGQKVVEKILGTEYEGVLISDFLSAYNKITTKAKQRCLIHLLRDLKNVIEYWPDDHHILRYCERLKKILKAAIQLYKEYSIKEWDSQYYLRRERIVDQLRDFNFPDPNKRILKRFAKRLNRHKEELFTFLYEPNIDYHNNHAEQQIRPDVIFRKITFGNRSEKGVENHNVLVSVLQTAKLNGLAPLDTLRKILLSRNNRSFFNALVPP